MTLSLWTAVVFIDKPIVSRPSSESREKRFERNRPLTSRFFRNNKQHTDFQWARPPSIFAVPCTGRLYSRPDPVNRAGAPLQPIELFFSYKFSVSFRQQTLARGTDLLQESGSQIKPCITISFRFVRINYCLCQD